MSPVPLILTEEHHEAFLAWHWAVASGVLPPSGSTLVHVDHHADLAAPRLAAAPGAPGDLPAARRLVYADLDVGSFIIPALYQGLFGRVVWLRPDHDPRESLRARRLVVTARPEAPHTLIAEEERLLNLQSTGMPRRSVLVEQRTPEEPLALDDPIVLGIDLDVLCSNPYPHHADHRLEVTAACLQAFETDPYHFLRISPGGRVTSLRDGDRCYLLFNATPPGQWRGSAAERAAIAATAARLEAALARLAARPRLITVSRSRRSGYLPAAHAEHAEQLVLALLRRLFEPETHAVAELA